MTDMGVGREFEGKDLGETLRAASESLGVPESELNYEVVEEGRRGVLGMGWRPVRIWVELPPEAAARHQAEVMPPARERSPEQGQVEETLHRMFQLMGLDLRIRSRAVEEGLRVEVGGPDRGLLARKEGELLSALQFLLNRMTRRSWPGVGRVQLHCDGYRNRRDEDLVDMVREVARQVARTGRSNRLHPMNPYERRLVHLTVREFPGVTTHSEGEGFLKKVTVAPARRQAGE